MNVRHRVYAGVGGVLTLLVIGLFGIPMLRAEDATSTVIEEENALYSRDACFGGKETPDIRRPPPPFPRLIIGEDLMPQISLDIKSMIEIMAVFSPPETKERVSIFAVPGSPRSGDSLRLFASQENYTSDFSRMYYGWCINNVSAQGWVAGGRDVLARNQNMTNPQSELYGQYRPVFPDAIVGEIQPEDVPFVNDRTEFTSNPLSMIPQVSNPPSVNGPLWNDDNNINGCCYTVYRELLPGRDANHDGIDDQWQQRYFGTLPDDPTVTTPNQQDPAFAFADPDQDGYRAADYKGDTDFLVPTPSVQANPVYQPRGEWTPNGKICTRRSYSFTGDGCFTNYEEWTWGTNPLDADTDDDGYPDEADIVGLGQNRFEYKPIAFPGDVTMARVIAVGKVMAKDPRTGRHPNRIATNGIAVQWRSSNELSVMLTSPLELARANGQIELQANIQGTETPPGTLSYEWSVNGRKLPGPGSVEGQDIYSISGYGDILRYDVPHEASGGDRYQFQVRVIDDGEAQAAKAEKVIAVAERIEINAEPLAFEPIDSTACRNANEDERRDACERLVRVTAILSDFEEDAEKFAFAWFVDGTLALTGCGPEGISVCGIGSDSILLRIQDNRDHEVRVRLIQRSPLGGSVSANPYTDPELDRVIARGFIMVGPIQTDPARATPTVTPDAPVGEELQQQTFRVTLDQRGPDEAISYHWLVNGEERGVTYNEPMWTFIPTEAGEYDVSVRIERQGGSSTIASSTYRVEARPVAISVWTATLSRWFDNGGKSFLWILGVAGAVLVAWLGLKRLPA